MSVHALVESVACPYCRAAAGSPCVDAFDVPLQCGPHFARWSAAAEAGVKVREATS